MPCSWHGASSSAVFIEGTAAAGRTSLHLRGTGTSANGRCAATPLLSAKPLHFSAAAGAPLQGCLVSETSQGRHRPRRQGRWGMLQQFRLWVRAEDASLRRCSSRCSPTWRCGGCHIRSCSHLGCRGRCSPATSWRNAMPSRTGSSHWLRRHARTWRRLRGCTLSSRSSPGAWKPPTQGLSSACRSSLTSTTRSGICDEDPDGGALRLERASHPPSDLTSTVRPAAWVDGCSSSRAEFRPRLCRRAVSMRSRCSKRVLKMG
mmetsp:Transcript_88360/g.205574  ORF Transcript_88360/g.205574 Transcript_88360/m.205574 type:complete len:261 (+) Transcript_88360:1766-2548(+)